jgi:hypothetical protein
MDLIELATASAMRWLKPTGALVVKMFQGEGTDAWIKDMRRCFAKVTLAKPAASRANRERFTDCDGIHGCPGVRSPSRWPHPLMCSKLQTHPPTDFARITH